MTPKVYFTDFCTGTSETLPQKLARLVMQAGLDQIDFQDKFVAIKIHFGELGNMAHLRPGYARVIVDLIKDLGGKPFLTDANTLYVGSRKNALDHIETAYLNGFSPFSTGCHVLIADGLKGTDEVAVPVNGGEYVKEALIGRAIMDADIVISINHFKGHEEAGFGGALKNLGMGSGSRAGKKDMHDACRPVVDKEKCVACGACADICAHGAPNLTDEGVMHIDWNKCFGCGRCLHVCPVKAIEADDHDASLYLNYKIAEYAKAVVDGRPNFHITLVRDVSPYCDCHAENDVPIVPDVGMFASFDPVALDLACAEAVLKQPVMPGSQLAKANRPDLDNLTGVFPHTAWRAQIEHAKKIGLGEDSYELITI
ncbi:MAG: DUF362 domain-containing protein [Oscillospiraceae bacterium]|nr:DUF362 domain-containing protein [Oscillospiraceae bacterium]